MKKIRFLLTFFMMLIFVSCVSVFASDSVTIENSEIDVFPGDEFTTVVSVDAGTAGIDALQAQLIYDQDAMQIVSTKNLATNASILTNIKTAGKIRISYTSTATKPVTGKFDLIQVTFRAYEDIADGDYPYLILDDSFTNKAGTDTSDKMPVNGNFASFSVFNYGDVTLDHEVDTFDSLRAVHNWLGLRQLSAVALKYGDVNRDDDVDTVDALAIQRFFVGNRDTLGNRYTVTFMNEDGTVYTKRSVSTGTTLLRVPEVPDKEGYNNGRWSANSTKYVAPDFSAVSGNKTVYMIYDKEWSSEMNFYISQLTDTYYSDTNLYSDLNLISTMTYGDSSAQIYWSSTNGSVLNATTGKVTTPTYSEEVTLKATIVVTHRDGSATETNTLEFEYVVGGKIVPVSKDLVREYLEGYLGKDDSGNYHIMYDMVMPKIISNKQIPYSKDFEVQVEWSYLGSDGKEVGINKIERTTTTQFRDLVATLTFNGLPLEGDGKLYFYNVELTPVTMEDVRYAVINDIALQMGLTVSTGNVLPGHEDTYNATVKWISDNNEIATVSNNTVTVKSTAIDGSPLPLRAQVTYRVDESAELLTATKTFELAYTVNVSNEKQLLEPGVNIDAEFHRALKDATGVHGDLTTVALRDVTFTYLDLSGYPEIKSLKGLSYCTNLRVLNISGLELSDTDMNQVCTLTKLQALIARDCGLSSLTSGGVPVLKSLINLRLLDLSHNNLQNLASVFDSNTRYGKLSEIYLDHNQLVDISALSSAPAATILTLSHNDLANDDLATLSGFKLLAYLSLNDNAQISDVSNLGKLTNLLELRLHNCNISSVTSLRNLKDLQSLYLGNNNITSITNLKYLYKLRVLYLNDNQISDVSVLGNLTKLVNLNVNNNAITDLSSISNLTDLIAVYAENNQIASFSFINNLTKLQHLGLAHNQTTYESSLQGYLSYLTEMQSITLSGKDLRSLEFVQHMPNLIRLEVENCNIPAYNITKYNLSSSGNLEVLDYNDNIANILQSKQSLRFLNISNNGLAYDEQDMLAYLAKFEPSMSAQSISFAGGAPSVITTLYECSNLVVLYADNLLWTIPSNGVNGEDNLFTLMTQLKYVSLENCGINNASWISKFHNLKYMDLVGNDIPAFDLDTDVSNGGKNTLRWLYLDNNVKGAWNDSYDSYENVLSELSLAGLQIGAMEYLPDMESLTYLDLTDTGLPNLLANNDVREAECTIARYTNLENLNITGLQVDTTPILDLAKLRTLTAVGTSKDQIFHMTNLRNLQKLYNKGVNVYLYNTDELYQPIAEKEGAEIFKEMEDFDGITVKVATSEVLSDNNPTLVSEVNDFPVTWTVSDNVHYQIKDNKLSVISYTNIDDDELTLTASITVYEDQPDVSKSFKVNTHIVRASENKDFIDYSGATAAEQMLRGTEFDYNIKIKSAAIDGFSKLVKPVYSNIYYTYDVFVPEEEVVGSDNQDENVVGDSAEIAGPEEAASSELTGTEEIDPETLHKEEALLESDEYVEGLVGEDIEIESSDDGGDELLGADEDGDFEEGQEASESIIGTSLEGTVTEESEDTEAVEEELYDTVSEEIENESPEDADQTLIGAEEEKNPAEELVGTGYTVADILTESENHHYKVNETAPLGSMVTINVAVRHKNAAGKYVSYALDPHTITIKSRINTVTFVPNGGIVKLESGAEVTSTTFEEEYDFLNHITVERTGYLFDGWFTDEGCTKQFTGLMPAGNLTIYAKWTAHSYMLTYDANGGNCDVTSITALCDQPIGTMPVPTRDYYTFKGWFTAADGGTKVTESTVYNDPTNRTVYAQWTQNPLKGWVKASELPQNAQVVNRKYSYNLTTYKESTDTSLSGYSCYDSYWVQSGSGSFNYASFPSGFDTGNWYYTNFQKGPAGAYENTTNKRTVSNNWAGYIYWHWMYDCGGANAYYRAIWNQRGIGPNGYGYWYFGAFASTSGYSYHSNNYCNSLNWPVYWETGRTSNADSQGSYFWFRFDYYTSHYTDYYKMFKYKKTESLESATNVAGQANVSNVVEWVQYRDK